MTLVSPGTAELWIELETLTLWKLKTIFFLVCGIIDTVAMMRFCCWNEYMTAP